MRLDINLGDIVVVNDTKDGCSWSDNDDFVCSWGLYDSTASSTYELQDQNNISDTTYGSGSAAGDIVTMSGRSFENMTIVVADESGMCPDWDVHRQTRVLTPRRQIPFSASEAIAIKSKSPHTTQTFQSS